MIISWCDVKHLAPPRDALTGKVPKVAKVRFSKVLDFQLFILVLNDTDS